MKIWGARLNLTLNEQDEYVLFFNFEIQTGDYAKAYSCYRELGKTWSGKHIPINMEVSQHYSSYKVIQGFERELNEIELQELKENMKSFLIQKINNDKDCYLSTYQNKINCLKN